MPFSAATVCAERPPRPNPEMRMNTARMVVTETALLPYPDEDWTAIVKVYLAGDAIASWHIEAYVLHARGERPRCFAPKSVEGPLPVLAARLQRQVAVWLNANQARVAKQEEG
jgi:hypothetical protein